MSALTSPDPRLTRVKDAIVRTENFPKPGITFCDFLPILASPDLTKDLIFLLLDLVKRHLPTKAASSSPPVVVGLDSRGFLIGPLLAQQLQCPFVPIRKKGWNRALAFAVKS